MEEPLKEAIESGATGEETKQTNEDKSSNSNTNQPKDGQSILKQLFYIYHKHIIIGPYNHETIMEKYLSNEIIDTVWVKNVADGTTKGKWCKINLSSNATDEDNAALKETFPALYNFLIPEIKSKKLHNICNLLIFQKRH